MFRLVNRILNYLNIASVSDYTISLVALACLTLSQSVFISYKCKLNIAGINLRNAGNSLWVAGIGLRIAGTDLWNTGTDLRIAGTNLQSLQRTLNNK